MTPQMQKQIEAIPDNGEWWKSSSLESFEDAGEQLIDHGYSEHEAVLFLTNLYIAMADEFGS